MRICALTRRWLPLMFAAAVFGQHDIVLKGGRVLDPETGLDGVRNVGIRAGKIAAVSDRPLAGAQVIDVAGLVVAPGFIDLHAHGQTEENHKVQALDGVTTALELEVGVSPLARWYETKTGKTLIHFGATAGHIPARKLLMKDSSPSLVPRDEAAKRPASAAELGQLREQVARDLRDGGLGVGFGIGYTPAASREEILSMFELAAASGRPCFVHLRHMGNVEPNGVDGLQEVIANAAVAGAALHVVHVTSMGLRFTPLLLRMIEGARRRGMDVTTEAYPYGAANTDIASALFAPGWQQRLGITYKDLQWNATGERLTDETFGRYREQGGGVVMHMIPPEAVKAALTHPLVMIASDGGLENGKGHPRSSGTFSRVLGRYVREERWLTLMDAVRKMTLMPAQRLERVTPQMKNKGRIRVGADADITVFDAARVIDRATFEQPALPSEGIRFVLVSGTPVVRDGALVKGVSPGQPIRAN